MKYGRKITVAIVFVIITSLFLSSCGLLDSVGKRDDSEDIETVVSDFLDSIADGSFADDDFKSDLISDKGFSKLKFSDKDAEDLMVIAFEKIGYEIGKIKGDSEDEEATCKVTITAIDLDKIMDDLDEDYELEDIEDAIKAKKAPTEEYDVTLDLEYDDKEWIITDLSDLIDAVAEPFTKIETQGIAPTTVAPPTEATTTQTETTAPTTVKVIADEFIENTYEYGWCDKDITMYVDSYGPEDRQITFIMSFSNPMPYLVFTCEFYYNDEALPFVSEQYTMGAEDYSYYVGRKYDTAIQPGTYRVVIRMTDNSVALDESIIVT